MRGRLIFPFNVDYRRLDIAGSSYDHDLMEPATVDDGSQLGTDGRAEMAQTLIPAQIEDDFFEEVQMVATGDSPDTEYYVVHHFRDLERLGLVDAATGNALAPKKGDRLEAVYDKRGVVVFTPPNPPGMYVDEVTPEMGLGRRRNLLIVKLVDRETGVRS
jgi:hypothetical protein